ncbi:transposase [Streptomyces sioyaensis]|uniref:transposase n=1 Tax=Streptomyces sioyaensis TaxID=67364 RepID=UPI0037CF2B23
MSHHRWGSCCGKNCRYATNLQVVIDANSRLVVAIGLPVPGSRNDCRAFTESGVDRACRGAPTIADGGYQAPACSSRTANDKVSSTSARNRKQRTPSTAGREHAWSTPLPRLKNWKILRDCRLKGNGVHQAMPAIARLHNLALAR